MVYVCVSVCGTVSTFGKDIKTENECFMKDEWTMMRRTKTQGNYKKQELLR